MNREGPYESSGSKFCRLPYHLRMFYKSSRDTLIWSNCHKNITNRCQAIPETSSVRGTRQLAINIDVHMLHSQHVSILLHQLVWKNVLDRKFTWVFKFWFYKLFEEIYPLTILKMLYCIFISQKWWSKIYLFKI